jgi:hypothetical protein
MKGLVERVQHLEDIHQVRNLMSRYVYLHAAGEFNKLADFFASKTPGVRAEMSWGVYEGTKGIKRLFQDFYAHRVGDRIGYMVLQPVTTPLIEVAGDGYTAKGLWISTGNTTEANTPGGKVEGYWSWMKFGIDFIKEQGEWKFWHFQTYSILFTPYHVGWVEKNENIIITMPDEFKPDRPATYNWIYKPTGKVELVPVPPEPYETWDDKSMTTSKGK